MGDFYGDGLPTEITSDATVFNDAFIKRGEQRYNIHCAICHGASGNGKGVTSKYGILDRLQLPAAGQHRSEPTPPPSARTERSLMSSPTARA
jgi:hypothetical protein